MASFGVSWHRWGPISQRYWDVSLTLRPPYRNGWRTASLGFHQSSYKRLGCNQGQHLWSQIRENTLTKDLTDHSKRALRFFYTHINTILIPNLIFDSPVLRTLLLSSEHSMAILLGEWVPQQKTCGRACSHRSDSSREKSGAEQSKHRLRQIAVSVSESLQASEP